METQGQPAPPRQQAGARGGDDGGAQVADGLLHPLASGAAAGGEECVGQVQAVVARHADQHRQRDGLHAAELHLQVKVPRRRQLNVSSNSRSEVQNEVDDVSYVA